LPHAPQLLRSTVRFVQPPAQADVGAGHAHDPFVHWAPPVHVTLHAPQLSGSV
jgi:hypothetical protein